MRKLPAALSNTTHGADSLEKTWDNLSSGYLAGDLHQEWLTRIREAFSWLDSHGPFCAWAPEDVGLSSAKSDFFRVEASLDDAYNSALESIQARAARPTMHWLAVIRCVGAENGPGRRSLCDQAIQLLLRRPDVISSKNSRGLSSSQCAVVLEYEQTFIRFPKWTGPVSSVEEAFHHHISPLGYFLPHIITSIV